MRVKLHEVALFSQQLSMLLSQGVNLVSSLEVLAQGASIELEETLRLIQVRVENGWELSRAMSQHPKVYSRFYILLIKVGEETGGLAPILEALGGTLRKADEVRRRMIQALIYPGFVLGSSALMVAILTCYMLPGFVSMFADEEMELPLLTRIVLGVFGSPIIRYSIPLLIVAPLLLKVIVRSHPQSGEKLRSALFKAPLLGPLMVRVAMLNLLRSLALLQRGGVDICRSLRALETSQSGYEPLDQSFEEAEAAIREGRSMTEAFKAQTMFPSLLVSLIEVGEETGDLGNLLQRYVDMGDEELESKIEAALSLLEPILMVFLGVVVGTIVLAAFLPTYQLVVRI